MTNPSGLCKCGCGEKTNIAPHSHQKYGWKKGQPYDYLRGHGTRTRKTPWEGELPLCGCGCGKPVELSKVTDRTRGRVIGQPNKFARGHYDRSIPEPLEVDRGFVTPCLIWRGQIDKAGYPRREAATGTVLAHRQIFIAAHGPVDASTDIHHLCAQVDCVRLDHLEARSRTSHLRAHRGVSPEKHEAITEALRSGEESQAAIARRFGVSKVYIWRLRKSLS